MTGTDGGQVLDPVPDGVEVAFDADQRARDRARKAYRVDGGLYLPKKKTGALVKKIIEMAPEEEPDENDRKAQAEGVDRLYEQVSILLVNSEGENPDPERLMESLDIEDAREMIGRLMGNQEAGATPPPQS